MLTTRVTTSASMEENIARNQQFYRQNSPISIALTLHSILSFVSDYLILFLRTDSVVIHHLWH